MNSAVGIDGGTREFGECQEGGLPPHRCCPVVCGAIRAYLATHPAPKGLDDLDAHDCVVFAHGRERRPRIIGAGGKRGASGASRASVAYLPRGPFMTGDAEQIRAGVLCGLGIAQVPAWVVAPEIASGEVQVLLPQLQRESVPTYLVHSAGRRVPMRVKLLMDYLQEAFVSGASAGS